MLFLSPWKWRRRDLTLSKLPPHHPFSLGGRNETNPAKKIESEEVRWAYAVGRGRFFFLFNGLKEAKKRSRRMEICVDRQGRTGNLGRK